MIKASELRLGNILNYTCVYGTVTQEVVDLEVLEYAIDDPEGFNRVSSPIPLTEQVLLDCGFSLLIIDQYRACQLDFKNCRFLFTEKVGLRFGVLGVSQYEWVEDLRIEYLHQLQNLTFALTGTELEYKQTEYEKHSK